MGIAQAGIAFKPTNPISDHRSLVSKLCREDATPIEHPNVGQFDIRKHADVMVQFFGDACFICNNDIAWEILENPASDITYTHQSLGFPEFFMVFCHYDSGGSYGYAFVEDGQRTRSRLQTTGVPQLPPLIEFGTPKDIEMHWLSADFYLEEDDCPVEQRQKIFYQGERAIEVPEYYLTSRILDETLVSKFGVCPWDTNVEPISHFFRLVGAKKPWWQLW
ncbi:MAG: hypothetical protein KF796_08430 [Ramlibacter sp.]|nr:hypothetical protein [Ramlibacter sp.]